MCLFNKHTACREGTERCAQGMHFGGERRSKHMIKVTVTIKLNTELLQHDSEMRYLNGWLGVMRVKSINHKRLSSKVSLS